ncbi:DUF1816 domain-containing protein [Chamaesiphon sp. OTE_20_metabat_361]|uniref:DUF1816 domain-containing protein n=1 Tax=Chamaesiphon sp. OTE_20_metabat_361 TaxID=2964689 RepID=UPI00286B83F8|nr:DUF1816 domain-containing protein [Chamaesiphon sp. OTE_20_metabat_361]
MNIQDIWSSALHLIGQAWWVEITTAKPHCTYYFGPFTTAVEADEAKAGYVEDLEGESAQGIQVTIKRCKPAQMTIDYEEVAQESYNPTEKTSMSGQFS